MRFLLIPLLGVLVCQAPNGQPTAEELVAKFRKTISADVKLASTPYLIKYRGQRLMYSNDAGRLRGEAYEFRASLMGHTDNPQKQRKEMEMKIGIVPFRVIEVIDGNSGWYQMNDSEPVVMSKGLLQGKKQREIHVEVFLGTEAFEPDEWQFSQPRSTHLRGQDVWEFDAKTNDEEPITLWFDKHSSLLMRLKSKATDVALLTGLEPKLESFTRDIHFTDWKKFGNRMLPGHLLVFHDGVLWKTMEPLGVFFPKTMDAKLFALPESKK